ncbi:MAG: TIGR00730 family Rossman fold protein [Flavobacteriaceae bacterium]
MQSIVVFCGSSTGHGDTYIGAARQLGRVLAQRGIKLVYGGGKVGLMGALAQSCLDAGGEVLGIIPDFLMQKEIAHKNLSHLLVTGSMHERKLKMFEHADAIMALPGGYGTLEELLEMMTWAQLGLHQKPIGVLNIAGFYNELIKMFDVMVAKGFLRPENRELLQVDETTDGLLHHLENYVPNLVPKWIGKDHI